jgi:hypothetical protein
MVVGLLEIQKKELFCWLVQGGESTPMTRSAPHTQGQHHT